MRLLNDIPGTRLCRPNSALSRSRAPEGAPFGCLTPHTRDGNFDRTFNITTLVDAAETQLSACVLRASLRVAVRSLSRSQSRARCSARKSFPMRRLRAEKIELEDHSSPPLDVAS